MNRPIDNPSPEPSLNDGLIDRLVDGELGDAERRELLLQLESEPDGWRRCALAFLEAQSWREAMVPLVASSTCRQERAVIRNPITKQSDFSSPVAAKPDFANAPRRRLTPFIGLAVSVLISFLLGWGSRGSGEGSPSGIVQGKSDQPASSPDSSTGIPTDSSQQDDPSLKLAQVPPDGERIVDQAEQQGFWVETQMQLISMQLKNGKKLNVPIQEVRYRSSVGRTY